MAFTADRMLMRSSAAFSPIFGSLMNLRSMPKAKNINTAVNIKGSDLLVRYKIEPPIKTKTDARPPIKLMMPLALLLRGGGVMSGIKATVGALKIAMEKFKTVMINKKLRNPV